MTKLAVLLIMFFVGFLTKAEMRRWEILSLTTIAYACGLIIGSGV